MKRIITIFLIFAIILSVQLANATMYECTYKSASGRTLVSSYNSLIYTQPNRKELLYAYKSGNCKELIVKRYFIDGTICNIQFYKYNKQIANVTCTPDKPSALVKIKAIARRDFGYMGK